MNIKWIQVIVIILRHKHEGLNVAVCGDISNLVYIIFNDKWQLKPVNSFSESSIICPRFNPSRNNHKLLRPKQTMIFIFFVPRTRIEHTTCQAAVGKLSMDTTFCFCLTERAKGPRTVEEVKQS